MSTSSGTIMSSPSGSITQSLPRRIATTRIPTSTGSSTSARRRFANADSARGRSVVLEVSGPSGIGKTALVHHFLTGVRRDLAPGAALLEGRCYEQESVAYKVLDGIVDALSRHLQALPAARAASLLPHHVHELAQLFPALLQVGAVAGARRRAGELIEFVYVRVEG